jgi:hypothetical protein
MGANTTCMKAVGSPAFLFTVTNETPDPRAISGCTVVPVLNSGEVLPKVIVPINLTYNGEPYPFGLAYAHKTIALYWYVNGEAASDVSTYRDATCQSNVDRGPYPICLIAGSLISTPAGDVPVQDIRVGDAVWSTDLQGNRIRASVSEVGHAMAPPGHLVVTVALADGRSFTASLGHPTPEGVPVGDLQIGDPLDGSRVVSTKVSTYSGYTYDLLPSGPTGTYYVGGVLLRSTLGG